VSVWASVVVLIVAVALAIIGGFVVSVLGEEL
jgi:hypothetical protein